jgi:hypothetical protein
LGVDERDLVPGLKLLCLKTSPAGNSLPMSLLLALLLIILIAAAVGGGILVSKLLWLVLVVALIVLVVGMVSRGTTA